MEAGGGVDMIKKGISGGGGWNCEEVGGLRLLRTSKRGEISTVCECSKSVLCTDEIQQQRKPFFCSRSLLTSKPPKPHETPSPSPAKEKPHNRSHLVKL